MTGRRTSIVIGNFRARGLVELLRTPAGKKVRTLDELHRLATASGWRLQAAQHGTDVLADGVDGQRLVQDQHGHLRLVRDRSAA